ncbi:MAG: hypothetical protein ACXVDD_03505 [Polyangia bacterium]
MRPLAMMLVMTMTGVALAQEPIAPAAEQADDAEVPKSVTLPAPQPPQPMLAAPPNAGKGLLLLPPAQGWGYRLVDGPPVVEKRWGLFTSGVIMLSVGWGASLTAGIPTGAWALDVPLIGPVILAAQIGSGGDSLVGFIDLMLVTDAAVQIGGLALMIAGGTTYKKKPQQRIELVPLGAGAAIRGSF